MMIMMATYLFVLARYPHSCIAHSAYVMPSSRINHLVISYKTSRHGYVMTLCLMPECTPFDAQIEHHYIVMAARYRINGAMLPHIWREHIMRIAQALRVRDKEQKSGRCLHRTSYFSSLSQNPSHKSERRHSQRGARKQSVSKKGSCGYKMSSAGRGVHAAAFCCCATETITSANAVEHPICQLCFAKIFVIHLFLVTLS